MPRPNDKEHKALEALKKNNPVVLEFLQRRLGEHRKSADKPEGVHMYRLQGRITELAEILELMGETNP